MQGAEGKAAVLDRLADLVHAGKLVTGYVDGRCGGVNHVGWGVTGDTCVGLLLRVGMPTHAW